VVGSNGRGILVTGGTGFVGANLVRTLVQRGEDVHVLLRRDSPRWRLAGLEHRVGLHVADLRDRESVRRALAAARPRATVHLAVSREPATLAGDNVSATRNLLEAAAEHDVARFVHAGSSLEYGPREEPLREDLPLAPTTLYAASKAEATRLVLTWRSVLPVVVLRIFSVFGPWEGAGRLIPTAIRAGLEGAVLDLTPPGNRRDFVYVDDVATACVRALTADGVEGEVFNVASGRQTSNEEAVALVGELLGRPIRVREGAFASRPTDTSHWVGDVCKARWGLGWEATDSLASGLAKTIAWFRSRA